MADTFSELVIRARDWLNRGTDVISDTIVQDCIRWAADDAYRTLRVPPLECTALFTGLGELVPEPSIGGLTVTSFGVPADLIEVIKIRTTNSEGKTVRVLDSKVDVRTFFNPESERVNAYNGWTRKGNRIYITTQVGTIAGEFSSSETYVELYYYRRLAALDALYTVEAANFDASSSFIELAETQAGAAAFGEGFLQILDNNGDPVIENPPLTDTVFAVGNTAVDTLLTAVDPATGVIKFSGKSPDHWLLNENEKLLIYGGLAEAFAYLQEDDQAQKYKERFVEEISQLNDEDVRRNATGGTIQMNFNGRGLI